MKISKQQVKYIANLARLKITEKEKDLFASQLSNILEYIDKLNQLDTSGIEPTSHIIPINNIFREDVVKVSLAVEEIVRCAPTSKMSFFEVPKVVE